MSFWNLPERKPEPSSPRNELSLLPASRALRLETDPYPHIVVENALPDGLYDRLESTYPSEARIRRGKKVAHRDQLMARDILGDQTYSALWREFVSLHTSAAFYQSLLGYFAPCVRKTYPWLEENLGRTLESCEVGVRDPEARRLPDICMDCQPGLNTVSLEPMTPRTAHLDANNKLFTGIFYLKPDADGSRGGDFVIYRLRTDSPRFLTETTVDGRDIEEARIVPYQKNCAVFFMNSPLSFHGVTVREGTPVARRLVNIVGGLYTLRRKTLFSSPPREEIRQTFVPDPFSRP
ncbi:MAG: 2OG-Fe(II) oxygenase [Verrucomicrobiae bacterium]|nr:2OG-Fe(II) oxygenase [Verrucomicrobiae bacterium]